MSESRYLIIETEAALLEQLINGVMAVLEEEASSAVEECRRLAKAFLAHSRDRSPKRSSRGANLWERLAVALAEQFAAQLQASTLGLSLSYAYPNLC